MSCEHHDYGVNRTNDVDYIMAEVGESILNLKF